MLIESTAQPAKRLTYRRKAQFMAAWFLGWPAIVYAYDPLTKPYDVLTLLLVIPGGALWLVSLYVIYDALFGLAEKRWPFAKRIRKFLHEIYEMLVALISAI